VSPTAVVSAPAKVNLRLRVLGKRADGYHDIDTLFQAIDLADEVTVRLGGPGVRLDVDGADLGPVEGNLAYRAAAGLMAEVGFGGGCDIRLVKRIPVGAGLGGGSSDGAAVLRCVAALLGLAGSDARVARVAAQLGSDVPFFLGASPLARGRGRGELLEALEPLPATDFVVVSPPVHVSTAVAYQELSASRERGTPVPEPDGAAPKNWADVSTTAGNDFQAVIAAAHSEIGRALQALRGAGASMALMSGSGSSVFGRVGDRATAEAVAAALTRDLGWSCRAVRTLETMPPPRIE
jgi:4-diphosphocytidyl-2-C-methyl-D-erythritol kinase